MRQFVGEDDAVLRVIQRGILIHEELVRVLIVKGSDLFAEEIDVFLPQRIAWREKADGGHGLGHVLEFLLGEDLGQFAGDGLPDFFPAQDAVVHRREELQTADLDHLPLDLLALNLVRRQRLVAFAARQDAAQAIVLCRELPAFWGLALSGVAGLPAGSSGLSAETAATSRVFSSTRSCKRFSASESLRSQPAKRRHPPMRQPQKKA